MPDLHIVRHDNPDSGPFSQTTSPYPYRVVRHLFADDPGPKGGTREHRPPWQPDLARVGRG
jgi:hypothetical protein